MFLNYVAELVVPKSIRKIFDMVFYIVISNVVRNPLKILKP